MEGAESTMADSLEIWACEVVRRKNDDIVRLKLDVEPRVERRESGVPVEVASVSVALGVVDSVPEARREEACEVEKKLSLLGEVERPGVLGPAPGIGMGAEEEET